MLMLPEPERRAGWQPLLMGILCFRARPGGCLRASFINKLSPSPFPGAGDGSADIKRFPILLWLKLCQKMAQSAGRNIFNICQRAAGPVADMTTPLHINFGINETRQRISAAAAPRANLTGLPCARIRIQLSRLSLWPLVGSGHRDGQVVAVAAVLPLCRRLWCLLDLMGLRAR